MRGVFPRWIHYRRTGTVMGIPFIGAIIDIIKGPLDKLIPDKDLRARLEHEISMTAINQGLAQMEINKIEAAHKSLFVAGWRPFIGWVCGVGFAWAFIGHPLFEWLVAAGLIEMEAPVLQVDALMELALGMLGLAGLRTYEKKIGIARER